MRSRQHYYGVHFLAGSVPSTNGLLKSVALMPSRVEKRILSFFLVCELQEVEELVFSVMSEE